MPLKKRPKSAPFGGLGKSDNVVEVSQRRISEAWKDTDYVGKVQRTSLPEESDSAKTRWGPGSVHSADDPVTSTSATPRKPLVRAKSAPLSIRRRRSALQQRQLSLTSPQRNNPGIDVDLHALDSIGRANTGKSGFVRPCRDGSQEPGIPNKQNQLFKTLLLQTPARGFKEKRKEQKCEDDVVYKVTNTDQENSLPEEGDKEKRNDENPTKKKISFATCKPDKNNAKNASQNTTVARKDQKDNISEGKAKRKRPRSHFMGNYSSSVFLPRQSFFSCHDNALVKHGLNPHTLSPLECRRRSPKPRENEEEDSEKENEVKDENNNQKNVENKNKEETKDEMMRKVEEEGNKVNPLEDVKTLVELEREKEREKETQKNDKIRKEADELNEEMDDVFEDNPVRKVTIKDVVNMRRQSSVTDSENSGSSRRVSYTSEMDTPRLRKMSSFEGPSRKISTGSTPRSRKISAGSTPRSRKISTEKSPRMTSMYTLAAATSMLLGMSRRSKNRLRFGSSDSFKCKDQDGDEYENRSVKVDPRPIIEYLKLVQEHPEQYIAMRNAVLEGSSKPVQFLTGAGEAYSRGQHYPPTPESLVVQAAYELGCKNKPLSCLQYEVHMCMCKSKPKPVPKILQKKTLIKGGRPEKKDTNETSWADLKARMSKVEKKRVEVEFWIRKLSTAQVVKAREIALRELGEENGSIRRWWLSQKYCRYLRESKPKEILSYL